MFVYFMVFEGFCFGGGNFNVVFDLFGFVFIVYDLDSVWNYEVGVKSIWLDGCIRVNVFFYYLDWSNI